MYKIMLADDEGIMIDSLRFIIEKNFGDACVIEHATTGRSVIELAENFKPDIAFMDIQMPGINGIDAMKEIRKLNSTVIFIILTAFDRFKYAKEAINLGVLEYLTKPVSQTTIVQVLQKAMNQIEEERAKRRNDLMVREKLEIVIPILENDFIYTTISGYDFNREGVDFKSLLGIEEEYGMMVVMEFGDSLVDGILTNPVGVSVKAQSYYQTIRNQWKEEFPCIVGPIMVNKIVVFLPSTKLSLEYDERILLIEKTRKMIRELSQQLDLQFKVGIGSVVTFQKLGESYQEAFSAAHNSKGRVVHIQDLPERCSYTDDYPAENEKNFYSMLEKGNPEEVNTEANRIFDWMVDNYPGLEMDIKLKVLELILFAEQKALLSGGKTYHFSNSKDYLNIIIHFEGYEQLRKWFLEKVSEACRNILEIKEERTSSVISKAKKYIEENFKKDISLDDVSRIVDISPYYFSKLFKGETGENFIEYLTNRRIERAKVLLQNSDVSIKKICADTGYSDPNYFSRIFKKQVGITPTEYREGIL